jgi:hypothetical protein
MTMFRHIRHQVLAAAIVTAWLGTAPVSAQTCTPLMDWNQFALDATVTAGQGPLGQIRSLAIVHTSVHDAVSAITGASCRS